MDWWVTWNAWETDLFGLTGILLFVASLIVIAANALPQFAPQVKLPGQIAGFSLAQLTSILGLCAFFFGFSVTFLSNSEGGAILAWVAGLAIMAGGQLEAKEAASEGTRSI